MKYLIIPILILTALVINIKISGNVKWQKEATEEWNKMLDPLYMPKEASTVLRAHKVCKYIFEVVKATVNE